MKEYLLVRANLVIQTFMKKATTCRFALSISWFIYLRMYISPCTNMRKGGWPSSTENNKKIGIVKHEKKVSLSFSTRLSKRICFTQSWIGTAVVPSNSTQNEENIMKLVFGRFWSIPKGLMAKYPNWDMQLCVEHRRLLRGGQLTIMAGTKQMEWHQTHGNLVLYVFDTTPVVRTSLFSPSKGPPTSCGIEPEHFSHFTICPIITV
jgi:hypothetical protein